MRGESAPVITDRHPTRFLNRTPAFFRDRSRNSSSVLQILIRRVDNCIHLFDCDVTLNDLNGLIRWKSLLNKNGIHTMNII